MIIAFNSIAEKSRQEQAPKNILNKNLQTRFECSFQQ